MSEQDKGQDRVGPSTPGSTREQRGPKSPGRGSRTSSQYTGVPAPESAAPAAAQPPPADTPPAGAPASGEGDDGSAQESFDAFDAAFDLGGVAPVAKPRIDREDEELDEQAESKPSPGSKGRVAADLSPAADVEDDDVLETDD